MLKYPLSLLRCPEREVKKKTYITGGFKMENNENGFDKNSFSSDDGGYTQAPNNYNMNGQPMGNPYGQPEQGNHWYAAVVDILHSFLELLVLFFPWFP